MRKLIDLTGKTFGRLIVLGQDPIRRKDGARWLCVCECGNHKSVNGSHLRRKNIKSCGCLRKEPTPRPIKHGHASKGKITRTYTAWVSTKNRCFNTKNIGYKSYGGRGIAMCKRWASDFSMFLEDMGEKPEGFSLERKDVNGNYEPGNCKWIPRKDQPLNRRSSVYATYKGETKSLVEWAKALKVNQLSLDCAVRRVSKNQAGWVGASVLDPEQNCTWKNI